MFLHTGIFTLLVQNFFFQVFTSIALLNMLIAPLNAFPWVLNGLTEAWISLKRIQRLLEVRIACAWLSTYMLMDWNLVNLQ
jgi:ABC-type multidrug transport system fused ATPase/permease subunit